MNSSDRDRELDRQLRDIPVSADLVARLKEIPEAAEIDAALDRELSAVEIPAVLTQQLHEIATSQPLVTRSIRERSASDRKAPAKRSFALWATAAAIVAALGIGWVWQMNRDSSLAQQDPAPIIPDANSVADRPMELEWLGLTNEQIAQNTELALWNELANSEPATPVFTGISLSSPLVSETPETQFKSLSEELPSDLLANTFLMRWRPLGANPTVASLHGHPQLLSPTASSVSFFPETKTYDRDFLLRESTHPFASPQQSAMRTTKVDVTASQTSYENVIFSEKPWSVELLENARSEEWLAATGKFFVPARPNQIELRTAAGPAVFAGSGIQLLQVGVVAGTADPEDRSPVHMTVAVTPPSSKSHSLRTWLPVKIALRELIEQLRPHDTISLVVMSDIPYILAEDATSEDRDQWFGALDNIESGELANLAEGIRFAAAVSLTKPGFGDIRRPLVVLSDRFPALDQATNAQLRPLVENASQQGIDFTWVQLEDESYGSILSPPAAVDGFGQWLVSHSLRRLNRLFGQQLHGAPTLVGSNAKVQVKWNAKGVAQYRLIGYQPLGGDFVSTSDTREMHALDSGTLLFEVVLPEEGENDIATVELTWNDNNGKAHKSAQKISRLQFAPSWQATPLSLQAAQLTEQCLALHQNSYFSRRRGNTTDELDNWTSSLNPALKQHASYPRLELLLPSLQD